MPAELTEVALRRSMKGLPITAIARTLTMMGAQDVSLSDMADAGLLQGTELGPGLQACDAQIVIIFAVPHGFARPAKRLRVFVSYHDGLVENVLLVERIGK